MAAASREELLAKLLQRGTFPEKVRPSFGRAQQLLLRLFRRAEITKLLRQLHLLIAGEIAVLEAVALVREHTGDASLQAVFDDVVNEVESGRSLADALRDYPALFDDLTTSMVEAGESSGQLAFAFDTIAGYREQYDTLMRKTRTALAYPALVVLVAGLVVIALTMYIVPVFASMYENFGAELPKLTQHVIAVSGFLRQTIWYWLGLAVIAMPLLGGMLMLTRVRRWLDRLVLRLPVLGTFVTHLVTARFCRTMGSLLTAGVDILKALQIAGRTTGNVFVANRLQPAERKLLQGGSFSEAVEHVRIFPRAMRRLAASGEKTGRLGQMLLRAADYYQTQTESSMAMLTSLVEPLIILVLGVFIAFILVAMYLPLFDLIGAL